ncbi:MAG: ankyrin repeat protein [Cocleimonas sp.]|jgi:ankyrin repeat protein
MSGGDWKEMFVAVQAGDIDLVKYYVSEGIDVNYEHPELMTTALIESVQFNHLEIARFLLKQGADPKQNAWLSKDNPLTIAKQQQKETFIQLFKSTQKHQSFWSKILTKI